MGGRGGAGGGGGDEEKEEKEELFADQTQQQQKILSFEEENKRNRQIKGGRLGAIFSWCYLIPCPIDNEISSPEFQDEKPEDMNGLGSLEKDVAKFRL